MRNLKDFHRKAKKKPDCISQASPKTSPLQKELVKILGSCDTSKILKFKDICSWGKLFSIQFQERKMVCSSKGFIHQADRKYFL